MTSYEHLGPKVPRYQTDLPAFVIRKHSIVDVLSPLGEAILTFTGHTSGNTMEVILVVGCHPRSGDVLRATVIDSVTLKSEHIAATWVPGIVADIARTKTLELFNPAALAALTP